LDAPFFVPFAAAYLADTYMSHFYLSALHVLVTLSVVGFSAICFYLTDDSLLRYEHSKRGRGWRKRRRKRRRRERRRRREEEEGGGRGGGGRTGPVSYS
jgi:hypothetical protein